MSGLKRIVLLEIQKRKGSAQELGKGMAEKQSSGVRGKGGKKK